MLRIVRSNFASRFAAVFPILVLTMVVSSVAYALDAGSGITLSNGTVALNETLSDDCSPASGDAIKWTNSTGVLSCEAISVTVTDPVTSVYSLASETPIDLASSATIYIGPGGRVSTDFRKVGVPVTDGTYGNLRCAASADPAGTALQANFVTAACDTESPSANATLQIDDLTTTGQADTSGTVSVTANHCVGVILTDSGDTGETFVKCSFERVS